MASPMLRVDWYSFLLGTQISATSGILSTATSNYNMTLRFPREYLFPSFHNGGNTIFLYRIKETGNWFKVVLRLCCRMVEKNILGGSLYVLIDRNIDKENHPRTKALVYGGILGMFFSFRYNWHTNFWESIASCISAAELTVSGEEIRRLILEENILIPADFILRIPYDHASFLSGAFTGCIHGIFFSDFIEFLEDIQLPDFQNVESTTDFYVKCLRLGFEVTARFVKVTLFFMERYLVGGIMLCFFDNVFKSVTGWKSSLKISPVSGLLLGLYLGIDSVSFRRSWKPLAALACGFRMMFGLQSFVYASLKL